MAHRRRSRESDDDSAYGTPSSLTSLLSPSSITVAPSIITPSPTENEFLNQLIREEAAYVQETFDRRRYTPHDTPGGIIRRATRLYQSPTGRVGTRTPDRRRREWTAQEFAKSKLSFLRPDLVAVCLRRKARREVLFALDKKPKRGRGGGARRRNKWSNVKC